MKSTKVMRMIGLAVLISVVGLGTASAEHRVNKKKKVTVNVEENANCVHGISLSDEAWGDRQLCADYPDGAAGHLQQYVGSRVEVEAQFVYDDNPKTTPPMRINKVYQVAGKKVYDPCAIGVMGAIAIIGMAANGADAVTTAAAVTPECGVAQ
jgi:hypothetical protein